MAVPGHHRLVFSGHFLATGGVKAEIWSFGINFGDFAGDLDPPLDVPSLQIIADSAGTHYGTHMRSQFANWVVLSNIRALVVAAGGLTAKYGDGSYAQADTLTELSGTAGASVVRPLQTAVCVSLNTPRPGASGRGRFFLPQTTAVQAADFLFTTTAVDGMLTAVGGFLDALKPVVGSPFVVSGKGFMTAVDRIRIGRAPDTMRSRRNALEEGYQEVALA